MSLRSLLSKEVSWSRHRVVSLLFVLLLLPATFAATSVAFQTVIPRDAPIAVTPQNDAVTQDDLTIVKGGVTLFSDPEVVDSTATAKERLSREEVYAIVQVPPGITDPEQTNATFVFYVDGSIVPFTEASKAIRNVMAFYLDQFLPADVSVKRVVIGSPISLSEYLLPVFLMGIVMLFAFTYVPYNLAAEASVLDRLRVESSLEAVLGAKLIFFTVLMLLPIAVFHGLAAYLGYAGQALAPGSVLALLMTFVFLASLSMIVMVLTRFRTVGRFLNVVLLFGLLAFSGLAYPVGYFSPLRAAIVRLVPVHYAMIITRSSMLKDVSLGLFVDWVALLAAVIGVGLVGLKLAAVHYRRSA